MRLRPRRIARALARGVAYLALALIVIGTVSLLALESGWGKNQIRALIVSQASRILTEGIVRDPGEVDMGLILGIGFPPFSGGLLRWADSVGLVKILEKLPRYENLGARYHPTEQMKQLAAAGKGFYGE